MECEWRLESHLAAQGSTNFIAMYHANLMHRYIYRSVSPSVFHFHSRSPYLCDRLEL